MEGPRKATLHMKKIIDKFRKQTEENIEIATTTALQEWYRKATELQVLRADKANRDLKGPDVWKLDKANAEAVLANLKADFQHITIKHHEEVMKLMDKQGEYVTKIIKELLAVGELILTSQANESILNILEDDEETAESG